MRRIAISVVVAGLALSACTVSGRSGPSTAGGLPLAFAASLIPFDACDDFLAYVKEQALEQVGPYGLDGAPVHALAEGGAIAGDAADGMPVPVPAAPGAMEQRDSGGEAGLDFSETNVQEEGVDEPDAVKTDGRFLYATTGEVLRIVDLTGAEPRVAATLRIPGWDHQLLLAGDRLLVMTRSSWEQAPAASRPADLLPDQQWQDVSELRVVNVADRANPVIEATTRLEGGYVSARMVDGIARVVIRSQPSGLGFVYPSSGDQASLDRAEANNREVIEASTIANWLPRYTREEPTGREEGTLLACSQVSRPAEFSGFGLLSVLTLDVATGLVTGEGAGVLGSGETVYASRDALYVSTTKWMPQPTPVPEPIPGDAPQGRSIMPAPEPQDVRTQLHKFDITDPRTAVYRASGEIEGSLLNQYSLSEHDGLLRVATTVGRTWWGGPQEQESESFVVVLAEQDGRLAEVGKVGGLGKGERIYSVRFMGDVGYVVTFRQTDPLYTLDLSDPSAPRVLGELKILGYSAYLHPVGEGLLLGIGQDADEEGRTRGTQVSLFDVSNLSNPTRVAQATLDEGSHTDAEYDPHAFLWWGPQNLAVIPVNRWASSPETGEEFTSAAVGFVVSPGGEVVERGRITHPAEPIVHRASQEDISHGAPESWVEPDWRAQIRRTLVVGDRLYTLSEKGLKASDLTTFADVAWLQF